MTAFWKLALIVIVTIIYGAEAVILFFTGDRPSSIIFAGYMFANIGLIWELWP